MVVDNASEDLPLIAEAVGAYGWAGWVKCVSAPINGGFAYGNNLGIKRAYEDGEPSYVHLLNPDTQVRGGAIGSLAQFLDTHSEAGIAGSSFEKLQNGSKVNIVQQQGPGQGQAQSQGGQPNQGNSGGKQNKSGRGKPNAQSGSKHP